MTNYKEILRLSVLGINEQDVIASCQCSWNTVRNVLKVMQEQGEAWETAHGQNKDLREKLFPKPQTKPSTA